MTLYAFTITVKPFKSFITSENKKTIYKKEKQLEQFKFVEDACKRMWNGIPYTMVSEEHKNGSLHFHGMMICTEQQRDIFNVQINHYFGRSEIVELKTHVDAIRWNKYINKDIGLISEQGYCGRPWEYLYKVYPFLSAGGN